MKRRPKFCFGARPEEVAVICAHPDDLEIGCYGLIAKLGKGVQVLILTNGERGTVDRDVDSGDLGRTRRAETTMALASLGCDLTFGELRDGSIGPDIHTIGLIEQYLQTRRSRVVIAHPVGVPGDHQDHAAAGIATLNCCARLSFVDALLHFQPIRYLDAHWNANLFVDISEVIEAKVDALKMHASQTGRNYLSSRWTIDRAIGNAILAGRGGMDPPEHFEAFQIGRIKI